MGTVTDRIKEMRRLCHAKFRGALSQSQLDRLLNEIQTKEPELPLGIGAVTEIPTRRPSD